MSSAARELNLDQSTISRYLQRLETWVGQKLFVVGASRDPDDSGVSVGLTEAGILFRDEAEQAIGLLTNKRTESAKRAELLSEMEKLLSKMESKLLINRNPKVQVSKDNVRKMRAYISSLPEGLPANHLELFYRHMRVFYSNFERLSLRRYVMTSSSQFDEDFFKRLAAAPKFVD